MEEGEKPGVSLRFLTWVARRTVKPLPKDRSRFKGREKQDGSFRYESILLSHIQCCPLKYTQFLRLNQFNSKVREGSSADYPKEQALSVINSFGSIPQSIWFKNKLDQILPMLGNFTSSGRPRP